MRKSLVLVALVGCRGAETPRATAVQPNLAIVGSDTVELFAATPTGLTALHKATLPAIPVKAVWGAHELIVQLATHHPIEGMTEEDMEAPARPAAAINPSLDGRIGHVTARGLELYAMPPATIWPKDPPPPSSETGDQPYHHFETPSWDLSVEGDAVYLGRCEFGHMYDGGACLEWNWTRVDQPDGKLVKREPSQGDRYEIPKVAAPASVKLEFVAAADEEADPTQETDDEEAPPEEAPDDSDATYQLVCNGGARFPAGDDVDLGVDRKSVTWLATEPPLFRVAHVRNGMVPFDEYVIFEVGAAGCAPSSTWQGARVIGGPDGLVAIAGNGGTSIRHRGREIGKTGAASLVVFR